MTSTDSDGDGMSDAAELYAGVDPTNRLSGFDIQGQGIQAGGPKIAISWPSLSGRSYSLYRGTNLNERFTRVVSGLGATPPMNTYTDATPASISYYRVEVE